ncbi:MAG: methionine biosynthesis protein MetW [Patescibacteria group bacterium]
MNVHKFEDTRWAKDDQKICFRHEAALGMIERGNVLDLGSGDGLFLSLLKQKGIEGEGLDISKNGIAKTRAKGLTASFFDFNKPIPFADNTFDTVVMLDVLEHLYAPETLLKEAARVSKKYVIIGVPNFSSLPARLQALFGRVPENNRSNKGHIYWFNHAILLSMLSASGLVVDVMRVNTFLERVPVLSHLMRFLARAWPNLFALSFVAKARKA